MPHDAEASLRDELTAKIASAQADIESKLSDLRNALASASSGLAITQAEAQLRGLALLQKRIDLANPASLATMRAEVAASVAATQSFVQQAQGSGSAVTAEKVALQQASEAARGGVTDFMHAYYDEHKFDEYLEFASTRDRDEYREREEERHREIEKALAEQTPQENLKALDLSIEQLKDAGDHGARRSPEFAPTLDRMKAERRALASHIASPEKSSGTGVTASATPDAAPAINPSSTSDNSAPPAAAISPDVLARLRAAQTVPPDTSEQGHGITVRIPSGAGRSIT